jgi:hypothetical protein
MSHLNEHFLHSGFRFGPSALGSGYREPDAWIWCGSVIYAPEEQSYFMFASRWSRSKPFSAWASDSEIVLAASERPEGPYRFVQTLLPQRGSPWWDGAATHNPLILQVGETYVLYYTGTACADEADEPARRWERIWDSQRIGVAWAPSLRGPWQRLDHPVLEPAPASWDRVITANPAVTVRPDGKMLMVYKSVRAPYRDRMRPLPFQLGVCLADDFRGPYRRLSPEPLFSQYGALDVEDPCIWHEQGHFHMLAKDMDGVCCGQPGAGFYAVSPDGADWMIPERKPAYCRSFELTGRGLFEPAFFERVQRFQARDGTFYASFAVGEGVGSYHGIATSYNVCLPLLN